MMAEADPHSRPRAAPLPPARAHPRFTPAAMLLIPAIDLKDGHCVRLQQGAMEKVTVFSEDPGAMAQHWAKQGARRLHLVDLNGAFAGRPRNEAAIKAIV